MKKNHFLYETLFFSIAVIGVLSQIIITILYSQTHINSLDTLIDNWSYGPITKLFKRDGDKCPEKQNVLHNQKWKGTLAGRRDYFGNIIPIANNVSELFGVDTILPLQEHNLSKWRGHLLCGERLNINSYFDLTIIPKGSKKCPRDMSLCGVIDSLNNNLCLSDKETCPLNYIDVYKDPNFMTTDEYIKYDDVYMFMSNANINSGLKNYFIIKDIVFSEGVPCIDSSYVNMTDKPYILEHHYTRTKCPLPTLNEVFIPFDSYSKARFYNENGISEKLNELPKFEGIPRYININMFKRSYIGFNVTCMSLLSKPKEVITDLTIIKREFIKSLKWNTITIMIDIATFLLFIVKFSVILTKKYVQKIRKPSYTKPILMILTVFSCIFSCIIFSNLPTSPLVSILNNSQCIDQNTYSMLNPVMNRINLIKLFGIITIVIKSILTLRYGILTAIKYAN